MQRKMILEYNSEMQETMMKKNDKMLLNFCNYQQEILIAIYIFLNMHELNSKNNTVQDDKMT